MTARASYEHILSETSSLNLVYVLDRVDPSDPEAEPTAGHSASMALLIDLGGADITVQVSLTRDAEATGWTTDISLSAGMDLL